jgi:hypothetical protein
MAESFDFDDAVTEYESLRDQLELPDDDDDVAAMEARRDEIKAMIVNELVRRFNRRIARRLDDPAQASATLEAYMEEHGAEAVAKAVSGDYALRHDNDDRYLDAGKFLSVLGPCSWLAKIYPDDPNINEIAYLRAIMASEWRNDQIKVADVYDILSEAKSNDFSFGALKETIEDCRSFEQWKEVMQGHLDQM